MSSERQTRARPYAYVAIAAISLSMLTYQILLTRVSALRLFFHFGFLVISNCLLGIGAAGTLITIQQESWRRRPRFWIGTFCLLYLLSLVGAYAFALSFRLEPGVDFQALGDFARFCAFNLVSAVPFFFGGAVVGMILTFNAFDVNRVYFTDLIGAGAGTLLCPFLLSSFGAGGTFVFVALTGGVAAVAAAPERHRRLAVTAGLVSLLGGLWLMPRLDAAFPVPGKDDLFFTRFFQVSVADRIEHSEWSTNSRVDVVSVPDDRRILLTRGRKAYDVPLPESKFILQDGSAGTFILDYSEHPESLRALELSMYSAALTLKERPRVFIIGVGGGNDVWAAKRAGASFVRGIELNAPILRIHRELLPHYSRALLEDPDIELVHGEGRSALMRDEQRYDVIQMTGIDTWTALTSGAYMLAENYLYTREALEDMLGHLDEGGVLQIIRMSAAMETLRLLSNVHAAMQSTGSGELVRSIAALKSPHDGLMAVLVKPAGFSEGEVATLERFVDRAGLDTVYLPGRPADLRSNLPARFILESEKERFIREFPRDISPTTDDRPYFFNFSRWSNPLRSVEHIEEPSSVSQGNPFFILMQLGVSTLLALGLIVSPLLLSRHRRIDRTHAGSFFVFFLGLGMGFIAIEVTLMQKLTLFLGHPLYSITVTLFSILVFTGLGSLLSASWFTESGRRLWLVPAGIAACLGLFLVLSPALVDALIGSPLPVRVAVTVVILAPVSFLLGVPLAYGIRLADRLNPSLVPWAWAVNACFTVVGSVLTVVLSMNFGFNVVLIAAALLYAAAFRALPAERATATISRSSERGISPEAVASPR